MVFSVPYLVEEVQTPPAPLLEQHFDLDRGGIWHAGWHRIVYGGCGRRSKSAGYRILFTSILVP
jgi:hypothetical protein